jgi:hypothetical protein
VLGGEGQDRRVNPGGTFVNAEVYDARADTWTRVADLPLATHGWAAALLDGRVFAVAGARVQGFGISNDVQIFDPQAEPLLR